MWVHSEHYPAVGFVSQLLARCCGEKRGWRGLTYLRDIVTGGVKGDGDSLGCLVSVHTVGVVVVVVMVAAEHLKESCVGC